MPLLLACNQRFFPLADQQPDVLDKIKDAMKRQAPVDVKLADGSQLVLNGSLLQYAVVVDAGGERKTKPPADPYEALVVPGMRT